VIKKENIVTKKRLIFADFIKRFTVVKRLLARRRNDYFLRKTNVGHQFTGHIILPAIRVDVFLPPLLFNKPSIF
jgi:hypothetical protein